MINLRIVAALLATSVFLVTVTKSFAANAPVVICSEPYPPFIYEAAGGDENGKKLAGIYPSNFKMLEKLTGLKIRFILLPWKRCLHEVEHFSGPGQPELVIGHSFNKERYRKYHMIGPIYSTHYGLFYSRKKFPDGPYSKRFGRAVSKIADMQDFRICGLIGWNYEFWYTQHNMPRSVRVDETPGGHQAVMRMVSADRCDVAAINIESTIGAILSGSLKMPKDIACRKLKGVGDLRNYMSVSRKSPRAEMLVTRLSTAIIYLKNTRNWLNNLDVEIAKQFPGGKGSPLKCL